MKPNSYDPIGENRSGNRTIGVAGKGQRINPETGRVEEEGIFGWDNTKSRTNPDTGIVQEKDLLAGKIQIRINEETGKIEEEGFIGWQNTEMRINPDTGIIQKMGLFSWEDTDERINRERETTKERIYRLGRYLKFSPTMSVIYSS